MTEPDAKGEPVRWCGPTTHLNPNLKEFTMPTDQEKADKLRAQLNKINEQYASRLKDLDEWRDELRKDVLSGYSKDVQEMATATEPVQ